MTVCSKCCACTNLYDRKSDSIGVKCGSRKVTRDEDGRVCPSVGVDGLEGEETPVSGGNKADDPFVFAVNLDSIGSSMSIKSRKGCVECE